VLDSTWKENPYGDGMIASSDPVTGGIIDCAMFDKTWFVIFNNDSFENVDGLASREDAIAIFLERVGKL
jgi:hypothetical protein